MVRDSCSIGGGALQDSLPSLPNAHCSPSSECERKCRSLWNSVCWETKRLESLSAAVFGDEWFKVHSNLILYLYVEFSFVVFVCLRC